MNAKSEDDKLYYKMLSHLLGRNIINNALIVNSAPLFS